MSISTDPKELTNLKNAIKKAFDNSQKSGSATGADPDLITQNLANEISDAVDVYVKTIIVTGNVVGTTSPSNEAVTGTFTSSTP